MPDELTNDERKAVALDALVNWCWNTEKHLTEARELNARRNRQQDPRAVRVYWKAPAELLMRQMAAEIRTAEPDTAESVGDAWDGVYARDFLDRIPDAD